jgi:hypothetical protein
VTRESFDPPPAVEFVVDIDPPSSRRWSLVSLASTIDDNPDQDQDEGEGQLNNNLF